MTDEELEECEDEANNVKNADTVHRLVAEVRRLRAERSPRIVAVLGGGDWSDASVSHLRVPAGADLKALEKEHRELRHKHGDEYGTASRWMSDKLAAKRMTAAQYHHEIAEWLREHPRPPDFSDWLKANHGAEDAEVEEIGDDPY